MTDEWKNAYYYYRTPRAQHPRAVGVMPLVNFDRILGFSAFGSAALIRQPVLMIAGENAGSLW